MEGWWNVVVWCDRWCMGRGVEGGTDGVNGYVYEVWMVMVTYWPFDVCMVNLGIIVVLMCRWRCGLTHWMLGVYWWWWDNFVTVDDLVPFGTRSSAVTILSRTFIVYLMFILCLSNDDYLVVVDEMGSGLSCFMLWGIRGHSLWGCWV